MIVGASPNTEMHAQISVGRLGVITEVDFSIIPQQLLTRSVTNITFADFAKLAATAQDSYKAALQSDSEDAISAALQPLDRTQVDAAPERQLQMYPCVHRGDMSCTWPSKSHFLPDPKKCPPFLLQADSSSAAPRSSVGQLSACSMLLVMEAWCLSSPLSMRGPPTSLLHY